MIANGHFRRPPAVPTFIAGGCAVARPQGRQNAIPGTEAAFNRYADRRVCRPGRASGDHL